MANKRLNAVITIGGAIAGSLKSAIGSTKAQLGSVGDAIAKVERRQAELNRVIQSHNKLGSTGSAMRSQYAQQELAQLEKQLTKLKQISAVENKRDAAKSKMMNAGMALGAVAAAASTAFVPIVQAAAFEKAMLGVAKQVAGARDESGKLTSVYYDMAKQVQLLGREIPLTTNEIAEMVAAGARMGVAREELIQFTKTSAMMASAFDLPAGELADQMGKIAGLYKIPIPAIGELADTINYLDDNAIAKGGDIIDYLTRVGGVASAVKIGSKEVAALGSTLLTLGERTETASTASNAFIQKLAAADKGTKKFKAAMEQIGLSTAEVQKAMQVDATGTILQVLDKIATLPKDLQLGVMVDMIGLEHSDTLAKLANNTGEFRKQLEMANSELAKSSMQREFNAQQQTTIAQWQMMKNTLVEVSVNIGSVLLPAINSILGALAPVVSTVADFVRENNTLIGNLVAVAGTILGVVAVTKVWALGLGAVSFAFNALKLALMTNPIGLALTAIAVAAVLIYKNWEPIKQFFADLWAGVVNTFNASMDWIISKINWVGDKIQAAKSLLGFGNDVVSPTGNIMGGPAAPALPNLAPRGASGSWTDNSQTTIQVTQQPGQNTRQLAEEITKIQERDRASRQRGRLADGIGAQ